MTRRRTRKKETPNKDAIREWAKGRPTAELLIVGVAITVCGYVIFTGILVAIAYFVLGGSASQSLQNAARQVADVINTLIGLIAGYLAGRTERRSNGGDSSSE